MNLWRRTCVLLYNIQIVVVVAKDKNAVVASHTAKRIGICSCFPDLSTCRTVKAIAIAAAHAAVGVEVDIVCAGAVAHDHDGALHREVIRICNCDNRGHRMGRCIHAENAALVEAGVCADIDPVANLGRGGRGGCTQCNVPFIRRNAILTLRVAPEEAAWLVKYRSVPSAMMVERTLPAAVPLVAGNVTVLPVF